MTPRKKAILVSVISALFLICCACGCILLLVPIPLKN